PTMFSQLVTPAASIVSYHAAGSPTTAASGIGGHNDERAASCWEQTNTATRNPSAFNSSESRTGMEDRLLTRPAVRRQRPGRPLASSQPAGHVGGHDDQLLPRDTLSCAHSWLQSETRTDPTAAGCTPATGPAARYGVGSRRTRPAQLRCIGRCRGAEIRSSDHLHNFALHHGRLPQVLDDHERVFVAERVHVGAERQCIGGAEVDA